MINIKVLKELNKNINSFLRNEWQFADLDNFGKKINWEKENIVLEAKKDNSIVGVLEATIQSGVMEIKDLVVDHTKKRQGIGKMLILKAEEIAREKKLHKIYLTTGKNWGAVRFYEVLGYQKTGEMLKHSMKVDYVEFSKFI